MGKDVRRKLARRIQQLRQKHGYTQQKLSELSDIDYKHIQRLEGKSPSAAKIDTLEKLSKAFGLSLSELLKI
jgi:transcriptional regulator with XRE-family HTH domain